jgi:hypothetical protein
MTLNPRHKEIQPGNPADTSLSLQVVFLCWLSRARQHLPSQRLSLNHRNCTVTATDFASSPSATRRPSGAQKRRQRPLGPGPIMAPVLTGRSLHFYPQMGIARPQTLALALSLGRLSASSNLCPRHETFDYRNLFLPHPVLQYHVDPQSIHLCPRHCI